MAKRPTILLTGFEPFAGRQRNGSATVVKKFDKTVFEGCRVCSVIFPVQWGIPQMRLAALRVRERPRLVVGFGEGDGPQVTIEQQARNYASGCDESGQEKDGELAPGGAEFLRSSICLDMVDSDLGHDITISDQAGSFLCNATYYHMLRAYLGRALFIHVPQQGDQEDDDYLALRFASCAEILRRAIANVI